MSPKRAKNGVNVLNIVKNGPKRQYKRPKWAKYIGIGLKNRVLGP